MTGTTYTTDGLQFERPSVDSLNGLQDKPSSQGSTESANAKATTAPKSNKTTVAPKTTQSTGSVQAAQSTASSNSTTAGTLYTPRPPLAQRKEYPFDPISQLWLPLVIVLAGFYLAYWLLTLNIRKHPPKGGFAHHHKHMHPGKPKPHVFKGR